MMSRRSKKERRRIFNKRFGQDRISQNRSFAFLTFSFCSQFLSLSLSLSLSLCLSQPLTPSLSFSFSFFFLSTPQWLDRGCPWLDPPTELCSVHTATTETMQDDEKMREIVAREQEKRDGEEKREDIVKEGTNGKSERRYVEETKSEGDVKRRRGENQHTIVQVISSQLFLFFGILLCPLQTLLIPPPPPNISLVAFFLISSSLLHILSPYTAQSNGRQC